MSTSLPPVILPLNTWVDLYDATSITVGVQLVVQNSGSGEVDLTESVAEPVGNVGINPLVPRKFFTNNSGNVGAWAFSKLGSTLQVEAAS